MLGHCGSCGSPLGALKPGQTGRAYKAFAPLIKKFEKQASKLELGLSTTTKLTGTVSSGRVSKKNAFALPAGPEFSCPGATAACEACYAQAGRFTMPSGATLYVRNWVRWRYLERTDPSGKMAADELVRVILRDVSGLLRHVTAFRLWESGDFHSQWSVDVWTQVMAQLPQVAFWGYTRSTTLDFGRIVLLPNFKLWVSTDKFNLDAAQKVVERYGGRVLHAYGPWNPEVPVPAKSFVCPATQPAAISYNEAASRVRESEVVKVQMKMPLDGFPEQGYAPGACGTCRYCLPVMGNGMYTPTGSHKAAVLFLDHDLAKGAAVSQALVKLNVKRQKGVDFDLPSPEFQQALQQEQAAVDERLNAMRKRRKAARKLSGLGTFGELTDPVERGLVDECLVSYGRDEYFPG